MARRREVHLAAGSKEKKADGHYAADLVLQLPAHGAGSVALRSVLLDRFDW
jgi:hypothetical protein